MYMIAEVLQYVAVASFAEAWIEILVSRCWVPCIDVASFAEAWIEIKNMYILIHNINCRLLRGGVD